MRIPLAKIYRAFPELDPFSDEQCEAYVARARARRMGTGCLMLLAAGAAGMGTAIALAFLAAQLIIPLAESLGARISDEYDMPAAMGLVGLDVVTACIVAMLVRDVWLRRAIRACIDAARCPKCDYSLLGLPAHDDVVRCPECGAACDLRAMGLAEEDLIPAGPDTRADE